MAYIGKSPTGTGVRSRYYYTATGGETSLSGADDNSNTLVFSDGNYVDVSLNGIALVAGTDYNTSTANTIAGLSALSASDIVEIVVYDIFTIADTVSAKDGGTFSGAIAANSGLNVGTIKEATGTTTAMTIDSSGRILTPARPAFRVRREDASTTGVTGQVNFNAVDINVGSHYDTSSYYFLVPITGIYCFQFNGLSSASSAGAENPAGTTCAAEIQKSSVSNFASLTSIGFGFSKVTSSTSYQTINVSCIDQLTAGEYVRLMVTNGHIYSDATTEQRYDPAFSGFLIG